MRKQRLPDNRNLWMLGFLGFLGAPGVRYFITGDYRLLISFLFCAFFVYFPVGRMIPNLQPDTRRRAAQQARGETLMVPLAVLALAALLAVFVPLTLDAVMMILVGGWLLTLYVYGFLFCRHARS